MLRSAQFVCLTSLASLFCGCGYISEARRCSEAGALMKEVSHGPARAPAEVGELRRHARRYAEFSKNLDGVARQSPKHLATLFSNLAKESKFAGEALDRAAVALEQNQPQNYGAGKRSLEATARRMDSATREIKRACSAR